MSLSRTLGAVACAPIVLLILLPSAATAQSLNEQTTTLVGFQSTLPVRDNDPSSGAPGNFEYVAMFPKADHIGWGFDPAQPGMHRIDGVRMLIGDTEGATANSFNLWISTEDPANAHVPDVANSVGFSLTSPVGNPGPGAFLFDVVLPMPEYVPADADVFISVEFLPESPNDSLSILALAGENAAAIGSTTWDLGNGRVTETGHGFGPFGGYGHFIDWAAGQLYFDGVQNAIVPLSETATFATLVTTNQTSLPTSNPGGAPGYAAGLFSARQPSVVSDRLGGSRQDEVSLLFADADLTQSELVGFFLGAFAQVPFDLGALLPGSTGTFCLDPAGAVVELGTLVLDASGSARLPLTIAAPQRPNLLGLEFVFTAIGLDFVTSTAHAASCGIVRF